MEVVPFAGDGAEFCFFAVAKHDDGVVMEDVGDGVAVVRVVAVVRGFEISVDVFAFDEEEGQAVDEADDVCSSAVEVALYPQFAYAEEVVVFGGFKIEDSEASLRLLAVGVAKCGGYAVEDEVVFFAVGGDDALRSSGGCDFPDRVVVGVFGQAGVQSSQCGEQIACEHYFAVRGATEQAIRSEVLVVVGIDGFPTELLFEVLGCGLLNEGVFGVGGWVHSVVLPICDATLAVTLALTLALTLACHRGRVLAAIQ